DLLSRSDLVSLFYGRFCLDFSVTRQEVAVIDFQSEGLAIIRMRSASHGAVTDSVSPSAFFKIQIATGMGTEAVVAIRSEGARRANPVCRGNCGKRERKFAGIGNIRLVRRFGDCRFLAHGVQESVPSLTVRHNQTIH